MTQEERDWIDVILRLYSDLPLSNGVIRHTDPSDKKRKRIMDYLEKIADYNKQCLVNRYSRFEKRFRIILYYRNYIIKSSDIPQSYYDAQLRLAQKVDPKKDDFTSQEKDEIARKAISDQKLSLDPWIDYFIHGNGRFFPIYEQYWVFQGLQKLGKYDAHTGKFGKRNKNTVYPFPDLNEAAVEMTITLMENFIKKRDVIPELKDAFYSYNFKVLYEYSLRKVLEKNSFMSTEGIWKKYDQGSDAGVLLSDLRGKHTGWCVERSSWSDKYLSESDFYIFYTKDINGEYNDPRLCIRVVGNNAVEVRGIAYSQNVEPGMISILGDKLKEFEYGNFSQKLDNMTKLNLIEKKVREGVNLSKDELEFLYEISGVITCFGTDQDLRIKEIISKRNVVSDLAYVFGVSDDEVAVDIAQIDDNTKVYFGDIVYQEYDDKFVLLGDDDDEVEDGIICDRMIIPEYVVGNATIYCYSEGESLPKLVSESFSLFCPNHLQKLVLPGVGTFLTVYHLYEADEITFGDKPCYDIVFYDLEYAHKMQFPESLYGNLKFPKLKRINDVVFPKVVLGNVDLSLLFSAYNTKMPELIGGNLNLSNLFIFDGEMTDEVRGKFICNNTSFNQGEARRTVK